MNDINKDTYLQVQAALSFFEKLRFVNSPRLTKRTPSNLRWFPSPKKTSIYREHLPVAPLRFLEFSLVSYFFTNIEDAIQLALETCTIAS